MAKKLTDYKEEFVFLTLIKSCAKKKDLHEGSRLHEDILKRGLLRGSPYLASSLINMYCKCGVPAKGKQVLEYLCFLDVVSWNALISGYNQLGLGHQAVNCFEEMQLKEISPNAVTFISILKACGSIGNIEKGKKIHDAVVRDGLLKDDVKLGNALVDMYAKCGVLSQAQEVLQELPIQSVAAWNALIAGYTRQGQCYGAFNCFEQMQIEGLCPDEITFICILKACSHARIVEKGTRIHEQIRNRHFCEKSAILGTALVDMYAKCGASARAHRVLEELPHRNVISWSTLIAGYVQEGHFNQALDCFERMLSEGLSPDAITFTSVLKACSSTRAMKKGMEIHEKIVSRGLLQNDIVLGTALVDMYAKCGEIAKAQNILEGLPGRDAVSWNALIAGYTQLGQGREALNCFERMQSEGFSPVMATYFSLLKACGSSGAIEEGKKLHKEIAYQGFIEKDIMLANCLLDMYVKCGALEKAQLVLEELPFRNITSWNMLIGGYAEQGQGYEALRCFQHMQNEGLSPDEITFICLLKACSNAGAVGKGREIHEIIMSRDLLQKNPALGTALVDMYAKCGAFDKAQEVLEKLTVRNVISWSALIAGYAQKGQNDEALNSYERMQNEGLSPNVVTFSCILKACGSTRTIEKGKQIHREISNRGLLEKEVVLGNALVDMYAKCGELRKAQEVLRELPIRDTVSWNTLIAAYAEHGRGNEALEFLEQMQSDGISPNAVTMICSLKACGSAGAIDKGKEIHGDIVRMGLLKKDILVGTALIDMYVKCSAVSKAEQVLRGLTIRNVISWNAVIAGYAQHCEGHKALDCFQEMQADGLSPDAVTFLCVLNACSHSALFNEIQTLFENMNERYGIRPVMEHHTSMVAVLGYAGYFDKAMSVIKVLPPSDYPDVWLALLGACRKWCNVNVGVFAFNQIVQLDYNCAPAYVLMVSIFTASGMQEEATRVETLRQRYITRKKVEMVLKFDANRKCHSFSCKR